MAEKEISIVRRETEDISFLKEREAHIEVRLQERLGNVYAGLADIQRQIIREAVLIEQVQDYFLTRSVEPDNNFIDRRLDEFIDYLELLQELQVLQNFYTSQPKQKRSAGLGFKDYEGRLASVTSEALGDKFVYANLSRIYALKRTRKPENLTRESGFNGLYHVSPDGNVIKILKNGFKDADEHQKSYVGTGKFERAMGLNGIFVTRGIVYEGVVDLLEENVVFVFPEADLEHPHSVGILSEVSFSRLSDSVADAMEFMDRYRRDLDGDQIDQRDALVIALELLESIVPPEQTEANDNFEFCLDPTEVSLPVIMFVGAEPEYYYEQAEEHWPEFAERVAIITVDNARQALKEHDREKDWENILVNEIVLSFHELTVGNPSLLQRWKYTPEASG
jgi:hypothetical protein